MRRFIVSLTLIGSLAFFSQKAAAQVTSQPSPAIETQSVTLTFDASKGNAGLANYAGDIYAHIGVITDKSTSGSDWKYVKAPWPDGTNQALANQAAWKLTPTGTTNIYTLTLSPSIREYFGVPAGETVQKIALVLRSADGSKTGKTAAGGDIFITVVKNDLALVVTSPTDGAVYTTNDKINVAASANATSMSVLVNGNQVYTTSTSPLTFQYQPASAGAYAIKVTATDGTTTDQLTANVTVVDPTKIEELPAGNRLGLNVKDGKATFVLQAPGKKMCSLLGSFNGYQITNDYVMKQTPDGKLFWITLNNLSNDTDYSYQYLVDGNIKVADPYSNLILDPANDPYISADTYPNLPAYPTGNTTGIVSSFRMNPATYSWQTSSFTPASKQKLNIYEVLVRDFIAKHDYKTLTDTIKYFKNLGVNAIELMPINEFEGNSSWGYNPSFYFAPDKYYGPANDLKRFVDECHKQGIAVIMDMVLNHSFGQSPLVQLYFDKNTNKVTADNPWYNVDSPNTTYSWGYDFNHESVYTQAFVDSVNAYWMKEFKVDGFRFDFTKGFTQTPGDGWAYDAARIAILKRMYNQIIANNSKAIVICEHLTDNSEEKELAAAGLLLWGNINNNSCEAAMGYNDSNKSDLTWASYKARTWSTPGVVAYMESHDEERVGYKQETYGNSFGSYNVKTLSTALQRHGALASVFMSIPGPKMIWQWQELGYDHSINQCENGSISNDCRTSPKPLFWDKNVANDDNADRLKLKKAFAKVMELRSTQDAFSSANFTTSLTGVVKYVYLTGTDMNVLSIGNFDVATQTMSQPVDGSGYYYCQITRDSLLVQNGKITKELTPGEFHIYTSKRLFAPIGLQIKSPTDGQEVKAGQGVTITATSNAPLMELYINGEKVTTSGSSLLYTYTPTKSGTDIIKVVAYMNEYKEEKSVSLNVKESIASGTFGPNPVRRGESVKFNVTSKIKSSLSINVYSTTGKILYAGKTAVDLGENIIEINTINANMLQPGIYIVKIAGYNINIQEKIVVI